MNLTYTQKMDLENNVAPTPKKEKKTNKDFQKIFYDKIDYMIQLNKKSPEALNIYMLLMKYADTNNTVHLTVNMIMESLHICKQTVISALELLQQDGYLITYKVGRTCFYFLNPQISVSCAVPFQRKLQYAYGTKITADKKDYECKYLKDLDGLDPIKDKDMIEEITEEMEKAKKPANDLCDIDKKIVDTEIIDKADRLKLKTKFYNEHPELQAPTEEEIIQQDKDDKWLDDNVSPYGQLIMDEEKEDPIKPFRDIASDPFDMP